MMFRRKHVTKQADYKDVRGQLEQLREETAQLKKELENKEWASKKTNEGIKLLYHELEKKNQELLKLDELKSAFISTVSHELRTPLTTIRETVAQVRDGILGPTTEGQEEFLAICLESIDRLRRIIDNLLDISKIESGKLLLRREQINIGGLVRKVASSFHARVQKKNLELKLNVPQEPVELYVDNDKLVQIFNNLIGNALKFTEKGFIAVTIADNGDYIQCAVRDTGKGIAEEDLPKVFSKFQQFGRTAGPGEKGTGLGLSISKGLIELHKGEIWVESKLNEGTSFIFTLPKLNPLQLVIEYVGVQLKEAAKQGVALSIIIVECLNFNNACVQFGAENVHELIGTLQEVIKKNLRRQGDKTLSAKQALLIVLPATEVKGAEAVMERLSPLIEERLRVKNMKSVSFRSTVLSYPDDVDTAEELLKKLKEYAEAKEQA